MIKGTVMFVAIVLAAGGFALSVHGLVTDAPSFAGVCVSLGGVVLSCAAWFIPDE